MKKPFLCRIGIHQTFRDTLWTNIGTDATPMYVSDTYETCDRCGWSTDPNYDGPVRLTNACAVCRDCYHPKFGPDADGESCDWCQECGCAKGDHFEATA